MRMSGKRWTCQNLKTSESIFGQIRKMSESENVRIWKCQNPSKPENVRIWYFQILTFSDSDIFRIWQKMDSDVFRFWHVQPSRLDFFNYANKDYLICVDQWSGYPFYHHLRSLSSEAVLKVLTSWFNLFGWPSSIRSDGGPQFRGEFSRFCSSHAISKSNGLAEAGVKSVKNILRKSASSGSAGCPPTRF